MGALYEHQDGSRADDSHDGMLPRPGVNVLRRNCFIRVTDEQFKTYQEIAEMAGAYQTSDGGYCIDNRHTILPAKEGEPIGRYTTANQVDMKRILDQIEASKHLAQMSVVCIHAHANKLIESYINETDPDYYLEEFAHRCIDAGADAFVGTGTHMPKAIEIYKGKPIFYCTGNFIFQGHYISRMSADFIEGLGYPQEMKAPEVRERQHAGATHSMEDIPIYFQGIVPRWEMENGVVTKIELLPIEMGMQEPLGLSGFPTPMDPALLMEHMEMVCKPYGTKLAVKGDVIEVLL